MLNIIFNTSSCGRGELGYMDLAGNIVSSLPEGASTFVSASVASDYNVFIAGLTLPYFFISALILLGFDINPCYVGSFLSS